VKRFDAAFNRRRPADLFIDDPEHIKTAQTRRRNFVIPQLASGTARIERRFVGTIRRAQRGAEIIQIVVLVIPISSGFGGTRRIGNRQPWFIALAHWTGFVALPLRPARVALLVAWSARASAALTSATAWFVAARFGRARL
jgi:hypothetical protein